MSVPTTTIRIDEDVKQEARPILEALGLNISSAINIFLRAVIRCGGIPFDLRVRNEGPSREDFVAEYLAPIMSARNEIERVNVNPARMRERLQKRRAAISAGRRSVA